MTSIASRGVEPAYRRKLIEVDLPLDAINAESAREKSIRHGHPSTLHLWWARRPLAACRAVIFASMVDDPIDCPEFENPEEQAAERERLHEIIRRMVKWESTDERNPQNVDLLAQAPDGRSPAPWPAPTAKPCQTKTTELRSCPTSTTRSCLSTTLSAVVARYLWKPSALGCGPWAATSIQWQC